MLDNFNKWILNEKKTLNDRGIEIEEIEYRTDCALPFIKVIVNAKHYMGQICLYQSKLLDLEILNSDNFTTDSKLDYYKNFELESNVDWSNLLSEFFDFMLQTK